MKLVFFILFFVLGSLASAIAGEAAYLAIDLGATASQSAALANVPQKDNHSNNVKPESGINFVLYNNNFEVVKENTGILLVDDNINTIQTLATDKLVMKEADFLEVFINNDAQTPVFYDNLRIIQSSSNVIEVNAYYPFGMMISQLGLIAPPDKYNAYKYSAKELQTALNLNLQDFGRRMYDPATARFLTPDRFAEKYYHLSPYQYAANNPINNIDVNGDSIWIFGDSGRELYTVGMNYKGGDEFVGTTVDALNQLST